MDNSNHHHTQSAGLKKYLSPLGVWALAFGSAVGWGAFVMPGTTFLRIAGPLGTALGIGIGAMLMFLIGMNYSYLLRKFPEAGGTLTYSAKTFGYDHGFLSAWFSVLVYVAIIWANATALPLIASSLLGDTFRFGFHYTISNYNVWFGEALLSSVAIALVGAVCMFGKRLAVRLQILLSVILFGGVAFCFAMTMGKHGVDLSSFEPAFSPNGDLPVAQVFHIIILAPWAFIGFESVSHATEEFRFSRKKTIWLLLGALVCATITYLLLAQLAAAILPEGYASWDAYIGDLKNLSGLQGLPTFFAVHSVLGKTGIILLGVTVLGGIFTGMIGNLIASSRILYAMAREEMLPGWFGRVNRDGVPQNAVFFLMLFSIAIPLLGRTAIGWIVDVTTIGAVIAYGYTSAAAFVNARREKNRRYFATGLIGLGISVVFFLYFMLFSADDMSPESYLILAVWGIIGFAFFRFIFRTDKSGRFGRSPVIWVCLLFLILFAAMLWVRQKTDLETQNLVNDIGGYYELHNPELSPAAKEETRAYLSERLKSSEGNLTQDEMIQMILSAASLFLLFSVYSLMTRRQRQMEMDKFRAEQSSKAKGAFLSNMSHDLRTPMNAIVGYTALARKEEGLSDQVSEYLTKIEASSRHLLGLINDVLEMSRIESGKMELALTATDLVKVMKDMRDMFSTQMQTKRVSFHMECDVRDRWVLCDKNRLDRVLLNLISNAYKYTPEGGSVQTTLQQTEHGGIYELRVKDSGIGMSKEFAEHVFEAFEREKTKTVSGIQGTGLGMAITKSIVDLMGGTIEVVTEQGKGTEFIIRLSFEPTEGTAADGEEKTDEERKADFAGLKLLLVEDNPINSEIAAFILKDAGFELETAENGKRAVERMEKAKPGEFAGILMDVQMPVMNGYEATRKIREISDPAISRIPIIAMTANAFAEDVQDAIDSGMDAHISKPIDVNTMLQTLHGLLIKKE